MRFANSLYQLKENRMKSMMISRMVFLTIAATILFPIVYATADDNTCLLKAREGKFYVTIWNANFKQERQDKIFEGWIVSPELKEIKSRSGLIVINYKKIDNDRFSEDKQETCDREEIIRIP